MQRLRTLVQGYLSSHSAPSSYGLFAPIALLRLSVSLQPLVQALGSFAASGAPWSSTMPPSLGRGRVTTVTKKTATKSQVMRHSLTGQLYILNWENFPSLIQKNLKFLTKEEFFLRG